VLRTLVALCEDGCIGVQDLPALVRNAPRLQVESAVPVDNLQHPLDDAERRALLAVLEDKRWHMTQVAAQLGVSRNTLYRKLRKHGLSKGA